MGLTDLKKELQKLDKRSLFILLIADLYKKNLKAKKYLDYYVNPDENVLFEEVKERILRAFYPKRGWNLNLMDGKKALAEFTAFGGSSGLLCDLMLYYAEIGVAYTNEYGDISSGFYNSVAGMYAKALALMKNEGILERFASRAKAVVDETDGIGWGFHDELSDAYSSYFSER